MNRTVDIHKAGAVLIQNRQVLVTRSFGKDVFNTPGGKLEPGETAKQALVRELKEELRITLQEADLTTFGTFYAPAAGQESKFLQMDVFVVERWQGEPTASSEVEEIKWVTLKTASDINIASIFQHEILPKLESIKAID